jgi:hypothetical protein
VTQIELNPILIVISVVPFIATVFFFLKRDSNSLCSTPNTLVVIPFFFLLCLFLLNLYFAHMFKTQLMVGGALQVGNFIHYISRFLAGFLIGFLRVWQITLVTLSIVPLIALAGGIYVWVTFGLLARVRKSYVKAGEIAEEVCLFTLSFITI